MNTGVEACARVRADNLARWWSGGSSQDRSSDDVDGGAGCEQVGHGADVGGDAGGVVHGDRGQEGVGGGDREADLFGDLAG